MNIVASYDPSLSGLNNDGSAADQATYDGYTSAIASAVDYYDTVLTNPITITIDFGWNEDGGYAIPSNALATGGIKDGAYYSWPQLYAAVVSSDAYGSPVQQAALATLSGGNPTGTGVFVVGEAEAKALGLSLSGMSGDDGSVGLGASVNWSWNQSSVAAGSYDAVGVLEQEISHSLGRLDGGAAGSNIYSLFSLFYYAAADGTGNDPIGAAAGVRDIGGLNPTLDAYFSYDGATVTLPFETPAEAVNGDQTDWNTQAAGDAYGYGYTGTPLTVSQTDLEVLNVMGYDGASGILYSPSGVVQGIYQSVLGRQAGTAEVAGNVAALNAGATALQLRVGAATSAEAQAEISAVYQAVLGRAADPAGLAGWEIALAQGASASAMQPSLAASGEAAADIGQIYQEVLGRTADASGLANWEGFLARSGDTLAAVRSDLVTSGEGVSKLTAALATVEGHAPSAADLAAGQIELSSGLSLSDLSTQNLMLANSPTFINVANNGYTATAGVDVFVFGTGAFGTNTISGFNPAQDILEFSRSQFANLAAVQAGEQVSGGSLTIRMDGSDTVALTGVGSLGNANLRFV